MPQVSPKVAAGFGGANLGGMIVIVLLWAIGAHPPQEVAEAMAGIAGSVVGLAAGWATPHTVPTSGGAP